VVNEEVVEEINKIENGEIDYPQIILNGTTITD
jgi:disulfide oxidoreductase YuzD